jgi:hypothetical protein
LQKHLTNEKSPNNEKEYILLYIFYELGDFVKILKRNLDILKTMKETVLNYEFMITFRKSPKDFSRNKKMTFTDIIFCMLNFFKKDAQIEIDDYLKKVKERSINMSEQAFLKARNKILPEAFTALNDILVKGVYCNPEYFKTYKGYRLLAVDGTVITLNNTKYMQETFGYIENKTSKLAKAQASCLYDVENGVILDSLIGNYKSDERKIAINHIEKLEKLGTKNDLILFDRGYPSTELISKLIEQKIKFVMRVSSAFLKQVNEFTGEDGIIKIKHGKDYKDIRVINVVLKTGEVEKLLTNVFDNNFSADDFKILYFKRWKLEIRYDFLKNKLEIENFTGESSLVVYQDFYASIYLANLCELTKACSDELIEEENQKKSLKRAYKTNQKRLIAKLKDNLIKIVIEDDIVKKELLLNQLIEDIHKKPVAISPGREFSRVKKGYTIKFPKNKKRSF